MFAKLQNLAVGAFVSLVALVMLLLSVNAFQEGRWLTGVVTGALFSAWLYWVLLWLLPKWVPAGPLELATGLRKRYGAAAVLLLATILFGAGALYFASAPVIEWGPSRRGDFGRFLRELFGQQAAVWIHVAAFACFALATGVECVRRFREAAARPPEP